MSATCEEPASRADRLEAVLLAYEEAKDQGQRPDPAALLAAHPDLAEELQQFFEDNAQVEWVAAPLRGLAAAADSSMPEARKQTTIPDTAAESGPPLTSFGDYEVEGQIARGGMGVVYRARQKGLGRLVALKVIRSGELASREEVQRFRQEATMAAMLDHPHIVPVYEVGQQQGQLFFSMKLVEGNSLQQTITARGDQGSALRKEQQRDVARLLVTVARAVHHAHQRGILHRDLKPSNILLDSEGQPHVTDFGLAKRVEGDSSLTQSGALLGTPSYMAPEQARGDNGQITTATDVYGLGAVLYALLTGDAPFRGATVLETLEQVQYREPEPPSRNHPTVDRDLETITLKCLEKDPNRRYGSAEALAEDLQRWLVGEPILARRVGLIERTRRFVWRRPALASLILLALLSVFGMTAGLLVHNAQLRAGKAEVVRQRNKAWRAVDRMYTQVAEKWLNDEPGMELIQREFLEEAAQFYRDLLNEDPSDPRVRQETGNACTRLGRILTKLDKRREAEDAFRRAIGLLTPLATGPGAIPECRDDLAHSYMGLAYLKRAASQYADAEPHYRQALAVQQALCRDKPETPAFQETLAAIYGNLAGVLSIDEHRLDEAEKLLQQALPITTDLAARFPRNPAYRIKRGAQLSDLALLRGQAGVKPLEIRPLLEQAIESEKAALALRPRDKQALRFLQTQYSNLAEDVFQRAGQPREALAAFRESENFARQLAEEFPHVPDYRNRLADCMCTRGRLLLNMGRYAEAEQTLRDALPVPKDPGVVAQIRGSLARVLATTTRYREAATELRRLLKEHPDDLAMQGNLAWVLAAPMDASRTDITEAVRLAQRCVARAPEHVTFRKSLGAALYRSGDWAGARAALEKALDLQKSFDAVTGCRLAMTWWRQGHQVQARRLYDRAARWVDRHPSTPDVRQVRAEAAALLGIEMERPKAHTADQKK